MFRHQPHNSHSQDRQCQLRSIANLTARKCCIRVRIDIPLARKYRRTVEAVFADSMLRRFQQSHRDKKN